MEIIIEKLGSGSKNRKSGMEMVQVAILIAIAITVGLVFKNQIGAFVNKVFGNLMSSEF